MTVLDFCKECFKSRFGTENSICPAKVYPELCKFGHYCWEEPIEVNEEIKKEIKCNYGIVEEEFHSEEEITNPIQCNLC